MRNRIGPLLITKENLLNQEQFGQFWPELKVPLQAKWGKITDEDLLEIQGNLGTFGSILQRRYGEVQKDEVTTWANRWSKGKRCLVGVRCAEDSF